MNKLFLVGRYKSGEFPNTVWDFEGLFSTEQKAIKACRADNYFYVEVEVDKVFQPGKDIEVIDGTAEWKVIWPLLDGISAVGEAD